MPKCRVSGVSRNTLCQNVLLSFRACSSRFVQLNQGEPPLQMEWQPIETAPKDGRGVDVWVTRHLETPYRVPDARFIDGEWVHSTRSFSYPIEGMIDVATGVPRIRITHWMQIPPPPAA